MAKRLLIIAAIVAVTLTIIGFVFYFSVGAD
jgi:hypothetical protein